MKTNHKSNFNNGNSILSSPFGCTKVNLISDTIIWLLFQFCLKQKHPYYALSLTTGVSNFFGTLLAERNLVKKLCSSFVYEVLSWFS